MNAEMLELARRAVACDGWRWIYGTPARATFDGEEIRLTCLGSTPGSHTADFYCLDYMEPWDNIHVDDQQGMGLVPDFDEPAAAGCLLHLVREVIGAQISTVKTSIGWMIPGVVETPQDTEIHALVRALKGNE